MAKPKTSDWIKYYAKYTHVKVKRFGLYILICVCLPCTCCMSVMWADNAPWWNLPKRPGSEDDNINNNNSAGTSPQAAEAVESSPQEGAAGQI